MRGSGNKQASGEGYTGAPPASGNDLLTSEADQTERLYRLAIEGGRMGIWVTDVQTGETFWDSRAREIFGVGPEEPVTLEKGISIIHPADRAQAVRAFEAAVEPDGSGHYEVEKRVLWPDGTERWVVTSGGVQFEGEGAQRRAIRLAGVVLDVTAQKTAELELRQQVESLRLALSHSPTVIWQQDAELRYRWIYNSQLGFRSEDIAGKQDVDLMEREEDAERAQALKRAVLESGSPRRGELRVTREGCAYYYDVTVDPLFDAAGEVEGITCCAWNVTPRRELEEELESALTELAELNEQLEERVEQRTEQVRLLARYLAVAEQEERQRIAHLLHDDIQQMLVALHIQLNLLENTVGPGVRPEIRELYSFVGTIVEATRALSVELSADVLQSEGLDDLLAWLARVMERQYQLHVTVEAKGPCTLANRNIRELIVKALRELLFNVVKHAGVREAHVEAWATSDEVTLVVGDYGAGFDVDAAFRSVQNGDSFGLVSVRERLRLFGGRLDIQSAPGEGTRITIVVPKEL